jgi:glycine betaine/proline transport system substrate-binding protein
MRGAWLVGRLVVLGACASTAACSSPSPPSPKPVTTIKLLQNTWDASRLDATIAGLLLKEQLGVEVEIAETDAATQWSLIASGAEHASFEVWPSGRQDLIHEYLDTGRVDDMGLLGPTGKVSWYVPTYLLTSNPQLATWAAYKSRANTALFATGMTSPQGQFTGGDPAWTSYDDDIIKNLGLDLKVEDLGTESAELQALDAAYARRAPILLYLWTPHAALAKYELTPVALPPYSDACYAKVDDGGVACDYPTDHLFKIAWPGLKQGNPRVYAFLQAFRLTTADQLMLLNLVDNLGYTRDQAAKVWIDTNQSAWSSWIPK